MDLFKTFAMETPISEDEFKEMSKDDMVDKLFSEALKLFKRRMEHLVQVADPVIQQVYETQGKQYENILIPVTDGQKVYNISCNLKEAADTHSKIIEKQFEKAIILHTIDEEWKEHLRGMDDLRQSVQNASYENKDPLLIYKLESYNLFKTMIDTMNRKSASILMRGQIPVRQEPTEEERKLMAQRQAEQEAALRQMAEQSRRHLNLQHGESEQHEDMSRYADQKSPVNEVQTSNEPQSHPSPVRAEKRVGRNDPCPCGSGKKYKNCHGRGL